MKPRRRSSNDRFGQIWVISDHSRRVCDERLTRLRKPPAVASCRDVDLVPILRYWKTAHNAGGAQG